MKTREGKGFFFQCWTIFAALGSLMDVPGVFGMRHFISTKALSFTAKEEAGGDASAALLPEVVRVFPRPLTVPGSRADLGEPQPTVCNLVLGLGGLLGYTA